MTNNTSDQFGVSLSRGRFFFHSPSEIKCQKGVKKWSTTRVLQMCETTRIDE